MGAASGVVSELIEGDFTAIENAAVKFSTNPSVWLAIAKIIYRKITARPVFTGEDYSKYCEMRTLYLACTQPLSTIDHAAFPAEWSLDASRRPLYYSTFADQQRELLAQLERFDGSSHALKLQIGSIVKTIAELYHSIDKRWNAPTRATYRPDGFEAMFCTELAMWAVIELPRYSIRDEKTAEMVMRRIEYCRKMHREVLIFRGDVTIANPLNVLLTIIKELEALHANLCQAHRAATFTDRLSMIDNQLLNMVSNAFNVLYVMVDGSRLEDFNVIEFLDPSEGRAAKMSVIKGTDLGKSIVATCVAAEIRANDFKNLRAIPTDEIRTHMSSYYLPDAANIDRIGFPQWVWRKRYGIGSDTFRLWKDDAELFLRSDGITLMRRIRDVHCAIFELCNVREMMTLASQLNIAYGNKWLFSTAKGLLILESLIAVFSDASIQFQTKVDTVWEDFYTNRYLPFSAVRHRDSRDVENRRMIHTDERVNAIRTSISTIASSIADIRSYARHACGESKGDERRQQLLGKLLHDYLARIPGYDPAVLSALRVVAETSREETPPPRLSAPQQEARNLALQVLCLHTGQIASKIRSEWIDAAAPLYLFAASEDMHLTAEEEAEIRANHTSALVAAVAFFDTSTGAPIMPRHNTTEEKIFPKADMIVAIKLDELFAIPARSTARRFRAVPEEKDILPWLSEALHKDIYLKILKPYALLAKSSIYASLGLYSEAQKVLLRNHCSRMVEALLLISDNHASISHVVSPSERCIINSCLRRGLLEMFQDMPWIRMAACLYTAHVEIDRERLLELDETGTQVRVVTPDMHIALLQQKILAERSEKDRIASEKDRIAAEMGRMTVKLDSVTAVNAALGERLDLVESMLAGRMPTMPASYPGRGIDPDSRGGSPDRVRVAASGGSGFFRPASEPAATPGAGVEPGVELPPARGGAGAR